MLAINASPIPLMLNG